MHVVLLDTGVLSALMTTSKSKASIRAGIHVAIGTATVVISAVSVQELGVHRRQRSGADLAAFVAELATFVQVAPFDAIAGARAADLQVLAGKANVKPWFRDAAIAACAEAAGATAILTANGKDFAPMGPFLAARVVVVPV